MPITSLLKKHYQMVWLLAGSLTLPTVPHLSKLGPQPDIDFSSTADLAVTDSLTAGTSKCCQSYDCKENLFYLQYHKYQIKAMELLHNTAILSR